VEKGGGMKQWDAEQDHTNNQFVWQVFYCPSGHNIAIKDWFTSPYPYLHGTAVAMTEYIPRFLLHDLIPVIKDTFERSLIDSKANRNNETSK
jgi:hypothetical protein